MFALSDPRVASPRWPLTKLPLRLQPHTLKSERYSESAAVNWNRSERRRGREERSEIRAASTALTRSAKGRGDYRVTEEICGHRKLIVSRTLAKVLSSPAGGDRKNSCSKEQEFFSYIRLAASYIELRSVIFASQVIFASRVLVANIISLKPQGFNITFTCSTIAFML